MKTIGMKNSFALVLPLLAGFFFLVLMSGPAVSQTVDSAGPSLPPPLDALAQEGAQVRYLGRHAGMDGWITMRGGQEQYFYATPDGRALVMGLLFDMDGKLITTRQVRELQQKSGDVLDSFAIGDFDAETSNDPQMSEFKTPAEQLYDDVTNSNWITLGTQQAPFIYVFIDPQCPHCHAFTRDLQSDYIESGRIQVRLIPVGLSEASKAQAAFLLAAPNPQKRWFRHIDGDEKALQISQGINQQGVERNMAIMQSWQFDVTPLTVYKDGAGEVKIVQGRAADPDVIYKDITKAGPQESRPAGPDGLNMGAR